MEKKRIYTCKELRNETGLSQRKFAQLFHIPLGTICDWEQGRRTPPVYVLEMIARLQEKDDSIPTTYITGAFALNISCNLKTSGDWHASALNWSKCKATLAKDPFGRYGIEFNKYVPELHTYANVANHIRACLDLIQQGNFAAAQGMRKDFICNEKYDNEIMSHVFMLKSQVNWHEIDQFMGKEYGMKWITYKENNIYDGISACKL